MIQNMDKIGLGSLIFVGSNVSPLSLLIRLFMGGSKYSHVAVYIGMGKIIEADFGGVQCNSITRYTGSSIYYGEAVQTGLSDEKLATFVCECAAHLKENYDYGLNFWSVIAKIFRLSREKAAPWNTLTAWRCSELVAHALEKVGVELKIPSCQVTPKDLFTHFTGEGKK